VIGRRGSVCGFDYVLCLGSRSVGGVSLAVIVLCSTFVSQ